MNSEELLNCVLSDVAVYQKLVPWILSAQNVQLRAWAKEQGQISNCPSSACSSAELRSAIICRSRTIFKDVLDTAKITARKPTNQSKPDHAAQQPTKSVPSSATALVDNHFPELGRNTGQAQQSTQKVQPRKIAPTLVATHQKPRSAIGESGHDAAPTAWATKAAPGATTGITATAWGPRTGTQPAPVKAQPPKPAQEGLSNPSTAAKGAWGRPLLQKEAAPVPMAQGIAPQPSAVAAISSPAAAAGTADTSAATQPAGPRVREPTPSPTIPSHSIHRTSSLKDISTAAPSNGPPGQPADAEPAAQSLLPDVHRLAKLHGHLIANGLVPSIQDELRFLLDLLAIQEQTQEQTQANNSAAQETSDAPAAAIQNAPNGHRVSEPMASKPGTTTVCWQYACKALECTGKLVQSLGPALTATLAEEPALQRHARQLLETLRSTARLAATQQLATEKAFARGPSSSLPSMVGLLGSGLADGVGRSRTQDEQQRISNREACRDLFFNMLREATAAQHSLTASQQGVQAAAKSDSRQQDEKAFAVLRPKAQELLVRLRPDNMPFLADLFTAATLQAAATGEAMLDDSLSTLAQRDPERFKNLSSRFQGTSATAARPQQGGGGGRGAGSASGRTAGGSASGGGAGTIPGAGFAASIADGFPAAQRMFVLFLEACDSHRLNTSLMRCMMNIVRGLLPSAASSADGALQANFGERALGLATTGLYLSYLSFAHRQWLGGVHEGGGPGAMSALEGCPPLDVLTLLQTTYTSTAVGLVVPLATHYLTFAASDAQLLATPYFQQLTAWLRQLIASSALQPVSHKFGLPAMCLRGILEDLLPRLPANSDMPEEPWDEANNKLVAEALAQTVPWLDARYVQLCCPAFDECRRKLLRATGAAPGQAAAPGQRMRKITAAPPSISGHLCSIPDNVRKAMAAGQDPVHVMLQQALLQQYSESERLVKMRDVVSWCADLIGANAYAAAKEGCLKEKLQQWAGQLDKVADSIKQQAAAALQPSKVPTNQYIVASLQTACEQYISECSEAVMAAGMTLAQHQIRVNAPQALAALLPAVVPPAAMATAAEVAAEAAARRCAQLLVSEVPSQVRAELTEHNKRLVTRCESAVEQSRVVLQLQASKAAVREGKVASSGSNGVPAGAAGSLQQEIGANPEVPRPTTPARKSVDKGGSKGSGRPRLGSPKQEAASQQQAPAHKLDPSEPKPRLRGAEQAPQEQMAGDNAGGAEPKLSRGSGQEHHAAESQGADAPQVQPQLLNGNEVNVSGQRAHVDKSLLSEVPQVLAPAGLQAVPLAGTQPGPGTSCSKPKSDTPAEQPVSDMYLGGTQGQASASSSSEPQRAMQRTQTPQPESATAAAAAVLDARLSGRLEVVSENRSNEAHHGKAQSDAGGAAGATRRALFSTPQRAGGAQPASPVGASHAMHTPALQIQAASRVQVPPSLAFGSPADLAEFTPDRALPGNASVVQGTFAVVNAMEQLSGGLTRGAMAADGGTTSAAGTAKVESLAPGAPAAPVMEASVTRPSPSGSTLRDVPTQLATPAAGTTSSPQTSSLDAGLSCTPPLPVTLGFATPSQDGPAAHHASPALAFPTPTQVPGSAGTPSLSTAPDSKEQTQLQPAAVSSLDAPLSVRLCLAGPEANHISLALSVVLPGQDATSVLLSGTSTLPAPVGRSSPARQWTPGAASAYPTADVHATRHRPLPATSFESPAKVQPGDAATALQLRYASACESPARATREGGRVLRVVTPSKVPKSEPRIHAASPRHGPQHGNDRLVTPDKAGTGTVGVTPLVTPDKPAAEQGQAGSSRITPGRSTRNITPLITPEKIVKLEARMTNGMPITPERVAAVEAQLVHSLITPLVTPQKAALLGMHLARSFATPDRLGQVAAQLAALLTPTRRLLQPSDAHLERSDSFTRLVDSLDAAAGLTPDRPRPWQGSVLQDEGSWPMQSLDFSTAERHSTPTASAASQQPGPPSTAMQDPSPSCDPALQCSHSTLVHQGSPAALDTIPSAVTDQQAQSPPPVMGAASAQAGAAVVMARSSPSLQPALELVARLQPSSSTSDTAGTGGLAISQAAGETSLPVLPSKLSKLEMRLNGSPAALLTSTAPELQSIVLRSVDSPTQTTENEPPSSAPQTPKYASPAATAPMLCSGSSCNRLQAEGGNSNQNINQQPPAHPHAPACDAATGTALPPPAQSTHQHSGHDRMPISAADSLLITQQMVAAVAVEQPPVNSGGTLLESKPGVGHDPQPDLTMQLASFLCGCEGTATEALSTMHAMLSGAAATGLPLQTDVLGKSTALNILQLTESDCEHLCAIEEQLVSMLGEAATVGTAAEGVLTAAAGGGMSKELAQSVTHELLLHLSLNLYVGYWRGMLSSNDAWQQPHVPGDVLSSDDASEQPPDAGTSMTLLQLPGVVTRVSAKLGNITVLNRMRNFLQAFSLQQMHRMAEMRAEW